MEGEYAVETIANRDAPIPVISLHTGDDVSSDEGSDSTRGTPLKANATAKAHGTPTGSDAETASVSSTPASSHKRSQSLQDRLFAKSVRCLSYPQCLPQR